MKLLLIVNPFSGKANKSKTEYLKRLLEEKYEVIVFETYEIGSITKYILNNLDSSFDIVTICGGDGTINETIKAISMTEYCPKIAVVPFGTMNDFSHFLKMSKNLDKSANIINNAKTIKHNIYNVNDEIFVYGFAQGMLSNISYKKNKHKKIFGKFSYYLLAISELFKSKKMNLTLTIDRRKTQFKCNLILATSTNRIAGYKIKKNPDLTIVIFKGFRLFFPIKLFWYFITSHAKYKYYANGFELVTNNYEFNTDGECNTTERRIIVKKGKEFEFITK